MLIITGGPSDTWSPFRFFTRRMPGNHVTRIVLTLYSLVTA